MKKSGVWCWFLLSLSVLWAADAIPGQRTMFMVPEIFLFSPGTWAEYNLLDRETQESYRMWFAVLERENHKGTPCIWMEVDIRLDGQPRVVTRFLAEETDSGPGELKKAIVSVEKFQGSDRSLIIATMGISDNDQLAAEEEFIYDLNRFNVLTSRAKSKVILLCSRNFLD